MRSKTINRPGLHSKTQTKMLTFAKINQGPKTRSPDQAGDGAGRGGDTPRSSLSAPSLKSFQTSPRCSKLQVELLSIKARAEGEVETDAADALGSNGGRTLPAPPSGRGLRRRNAKLLKLVSFLIRIPLAASPPAIPAQNPSPFCNRDVDACRGFLPSEVHKSRSSSRGRRCVSWPVRGVM